MSVRGTIDVDDSDEFVVSESLNTLLLIFSVLSVLGFYNYYFPAIFFKVHTYI